ncbi:hypothetical protein SARC_10101 [Sphaeroforma arctica JP610]|uniref:Translation initiation factor eIF2B subunit gamma n=1 Tax=Sphaeroforma arctica JP610 TaxID=667725 RepID=A0A0L0FLT1_9EUKA|nr:hypothetical protein SARC_10101 [Sphaeroforma arctica JP610]KNC77441.1 hypothetical protein SARC_10101 [Sphaeroforma arctica JP610]|eukprot:XP_014151343.1 hypothetical protein SARC_10101 [Sphaeroforma arctica JP610]
MYPLTESMKKAMLPVGNRPMIWYALQSLEDAGFQEIIVLIRKETEGHNDLYRYLAETYESKSAKAIRVVEIDNDVNGTADALRAAQAHIHAGVLVMSCDLVANVNIRSMVDEWRIRDADVCMALADSLPHERGLENKKNAKGIKDYIGLDVETKTVVYYTPEADVDEELDLSRRMFTQWPRVQLRNDLTDCHLYVMRKWVVDYIVADTTISSLKGTGDAVAERVVCAGKLGTQS